jgi:hypothetical protein
MEAMHRAGKMGHSRAQHNHLREPDGDGEHLRSRGGVSITRAHAHSHSARLITRAHRVAHDVRVLDLAD